MAKSGVTYRNFEPHERQRSYLVFYFHAKEVADYFESCLIEQELPYERGEGRDFIKKHLFGIHLKHKEKAVEINDHTNEFFRKPFLGDDRIKYGVLIFTALIIAMALVGYFLRS